MADHETYNLQPYTTCIEELNNLCYNMQGFSPNIGHLSTLQQSLKTLHDAVGSDLISAEDDVPNVGNMNYLPHWLGELSENAILRILNVPMVHKRPQITCFNDHWYSIKEVLNVSFRVLVDILKCYQCFLSSDPWALRGRDCLVTLRKFVSSWNFRCLLREEHIVTSVQLRFINNAISVFCLIQSYVTEMSYGNTTYWSSIIVGSPTFRSYARRTAGECKICRKSIGDDKIVFHECRHECCWTCWTRLARDQMLV